MPPCKRATMQACHHASVQPCKRATMQACTTVRHVYTFMHICMKRCICKYIYARYLSTWHVQHSQRPAYSKRAPSLILITRYNRKHVAWHHCVHHDRSHLSTSKYTSAPPGMGTLLTQPQTARSHTNVAWHLQLKKLTDRWHYQHRRARAKKKRQQTTSQAALHA